MEKKIALVTGGMGGIGTAICQALSQQGFRVVASYHRGGNHDSATAWQQAQLDQGYHIEMVYGDVTCVNSSEAMIKKVERDIGPIAVLVNNAGITCDATLSKMKLEDWSSVINTNLNSVFYVTRAVLNGMIEKQYGRIINISSINGQKGQFGQTNYAAAKAGMHGFTKSLALEVAKKGITVNTISPGYVATDMVMSLPEKVRDHIVAQIPMGRLAQPEEIARVVTFLADDNTRFITGANIPINGGHYML